MATVLLLRHGQTAANADGVLAGTSPGVDLDDRGISQVNDVAQQLAELPLRAVISSPLERTMHTAEIVTAANITTTTQGLSIQTDPDLMECNYGSWTGKKLSELSTENLWRAVQDHPSSVTFPGEKGESLSQMQARAVSAIRRWNDLLGHDALYIVVSHGDVIKSIIADSLGMHLDHFQRIVVDPASVSVIRYTPLRPFVISVNSNGHQADRLLREAREENKHGESAITSDAAVGGGTA